VVGVKVPRLFLSIRKRKSKTFRKDNIMKRITLTTLMAALCFSTLNSQAQTSWDFQFGYHDVFSQNALNYVVQEQNIQRSSENGNPSDGVSYWNPINNGVEATLTQEFTFPGTTTQIFLNDGSEPVYNFGGGNYGTQSVWASTDGINWVQLVNLPPPSNISNDYFYDQDLPASLLGSDQIWIQDRMETWGWDIMAQYLRADTSANPNDVFDLDANYTTSSVGDTLPTFTLLVFTVTSLCLASNCTKRFANSHTANIR
jgi:hypothetical protein